MVRGDTNERILLIEAPSNSGKSRLIDLFEEGCPDGTRFARIDFKGGGVGLPELLDRLCLQLARARFPQLAARVGQLLGMPAIQIDHNTLLGNNNISAAITVNGGDEDARDARRVALTAALFDDLSRFGQRVAIVFDTFNDCDPSLARWIGGAFLTRVRYYPTVVAVIAGQRVPEKTGEWHALCDEIQLQPIAPEHWQEYAVAIGLVTTLDLIRGICLTCRHSAGDVANWLHYLRDQQSQLR